MSLAYLRGDAPTDEGGNRISLEPIGKPEKLPVLESREALAEVQNTITGALVVVGYTQAEVAKILGTSVRTVQQRWAAVRPGAKIPKLTPVFGASTDWSPDVEKWRSVPEVCERCGGVDGPIQPGAQLACVACGRTGWDDQIECERQRDKYDEQRRLERRRAERSAKMAERRAGKGKASRSG